MNRSPDVPAAQAPPGRDRPRRLSRRLLGSLAAGAVAPLLLETDALADVADAGPAERSAARSAAGRRRQRARRHRRVCRHWHRCPRHRNHTCRHKHRCPHQRHRAPRRATQQPAPRPPAAAPAPTPPTQPTQPGPLQPGPPPVLLPPDPAFVASPLPTAASLHLASRFSYGITPDLHEQMRAAGSPAGWFEQQLAPASVPDPDADPLHTWWTSIDLGVDEIVRRDRAEEEAGWVAMANHQRWCLLRRILSRRQVLEVMTEFWENHLHVPVHDDGVFPFRTEYGKVLRAHALGRFDEMLLAAITHPAMGVSLDNASSTKRAPNENLARELLELHTVGKGQHTEDDVKAAARVLTGYRVRTWSTWQVWYDTESHATGPVSVVGFSHPNAAADGRPVAREMLLHLARHPATARRIARKLAVRFVSDAPSAELVEHLAGVYLAAETRIAPVLRALIAHPEFAASPGTKVRTPTDDLVATYRALGVRIGPPSTANSAANQILWQATGIGQGPFDWPRPDGPPDDSRSWSSVSRLLASFNAHYDLAHGWWPTREASYRKPADWLPAASVRFEDLVDHLCVQLLGRHATPRLQQAAREATQLSATATVTASHSLVGWRFGLLLATLLDSPEHLHR